MDALSRTRVWKAARAVLVVALLSIAPIVAATHTGAFPPGSFGDIQRVSLSAANAQLTTGATQPSISGNGRFVTFTTADNSPTSNDTNGANDVYVRDTIAGTTTLISKFQNTTNGVAGDDSSQSAMSSDGRWVAFTSKSTQWAGTPFTGSGVFVVDRGAPAANGSFPAAPGAPVLVSIAPGTNTSVGGAADSPSISGNGSQIVFHFVQGGSNRTDIRDRDRNHDGAIATGGDDEASIEVSNDAPDRNMAKISDDGRHVAYVATDPTVSGGAPLVVVYDRTVDGTPALDQAGNTRNVVATTPAFSLTDGEGTTRADPLLGTSSLSPDISGDGSVVVYSYSMPMKTPTPAGRLPNAVFQIIAVHRDANGAPVDPIVASAKGDQPLDTGAGDQSSVRPVISDDGRYVDFPSAATNLTFFITKDLGADCGTTVAVRRCDLMAVDLTAAAADRAPMLVSEIFTPGDRRSFEVAISATGQFSALTSDAGNFVPSAGDTNNAPDVFVQEWQPDLDISTSPQPLPDTPVGGTSGPFTVVIDTNDFGPWRASQVTLSGANPGDFTVSPQSCTQQVFTIGQPCIVAITFHPTGTGLRSAQLQITRSGHTPKVDVGLVQGSSGVPGSPGFTERASLGPIGGPGVGPTGQITGSSGSGVISSNGRYIAFVTSADIGPGDNNEADDVYVRDRLRGTTTLVSDTGGSVEELETEAPSISGDGRYIAVSSRASLAGDAPHTDRPLIYVLDRGAPDANGDFTATPVMHQVGTSLTVAECGPDLSADGSQVTYWTTNSQFNGRATCFTGGTQQSFVVDEDSNGNGVPYETGEAIETQLTPPNSFNEQLPRISADGLHVVFEATMSLDNNVEGPTAPVAWAYDRRITGSGARDAAGNTRYVLVSTTAFTPLVSGDNRVSALENTVTSGPVTSGDGSVVAYEFRYNNDSAPGPFDPVVLNSPLPANVSQIVVVHRDGAGNISTNDVASEAGSGPPVFGDDDSGLADISDDGRYVSFNTTARTLLPSPPADNCDGPCGAAVVVDMTAAGHAGAPQLLGPSVDPANPTRISRGSEFGTALSGDGRFAIFTAFGNDLLAPGGDTNDNDDVFMRELRPVDPPIPANVDFGAVQVGSASPLTSVQFTTNDFGPAPILSLSVIGANPGDFNILGTTGCSPTLADAAAAAVTAVPNYAVLHLDTPCVVSLNFAPTDAGTRTATLRLVTGTPFPAFNPEGLAIPAGTPDSRITTDVALVGGVGAPSFQATPTPLDFGLQTLGQLTPDQPLTVTNIGGNPFAIATISLTGANPGDFIITSDSCSGAVLSPLASCVVRVAFRSTAPGDRTALLQFVDTAGGSPHLVPITGRTPILIVNPGVVAPGRTANVIGMSWLPGQAVAITTVDTRDPTHVFSETRIVIADAVGNFQAVMVMFPKTTPGSRFVVGTGLAPSASARAPLLVALATVQAPNFLTRG